MPAPHHSQQQQRTLRLDSDLMRIAFRRTLSIVVPSISLHRLPYYRPSILSMAMCLDRRFLFPSRPLRILQQPLHMPDRLSNLIIHFSMPSGNLRPISKCPTRPLALAHLEHMIPHAL